MWTKKLPTWTTDYPNFQRFTSNSKQRNKNKPPNLSASQEHQSNTRFCWGWHLGDPEGRWHSPACDLCNSECLGTFVNYNSFLSWWKNFNLMHCKWHLIYNSCLCPIHHFLLNFIALRSIQYYIGHPQPMLSQYHWLSFTFFVLKATVVMSAILKFSRCSHHQLLQIPPKVHL